MLLKNLVLTGLLCSSIAYGSEQENALPKSVNDALHNNPYMTDEYKKKLQDMTARITAKANEMGKDITRRSVDRHGVAPHMRATGIADKRMAGEREKVLNQLGLSYQDQNIYIFISFSMPVNVIRAYAREAMWTGAILVLKGMGEDDKLDSFMKEKMMQIIGKKGASASIQIDPRLYDAFQITAVPTIVYTDLESLAVCAQVSPQSGKIGKEIYQYDDCAVADESSYWKIAGSVTLDWALEKFADAGSSGAQKHLDVLRENLKNPGKKLQKAFAGDWDAIPTPAQQSEVNSLLQQYGQMYQTPFGVGVGPADMEQLPDNIRAMSK